MVVFLPIFAVDTKIIFSCNFVAPLNVIYSLLNLFIDIWTSYITWKFIQHFIGIRTETSQKTNAVHCSSVLFCLLIKKLILECITIWQNMKKFPCTVWSVSTFPHLDKNETFFLENCRLVWSEFFRPIH